MARFERAQIGDDFSRVVNMTPSEIEVWLESDGSWKVGRKGSDGKARESVGHSSGRHIVGIVRKRKKDLIASDYQHMRMVVGFVRLDWAQRPENIFTSPSRYSLMNWGHDPTTEEDR